MTGNKAALEIEAADCRQILALLPKPAELKAKETTNWLQATCTTAGEAPRAQRQQVQWATLQWSSSCMDPSQ